MQSETKLFKTTMVIWSRVDPKKHFWELGEFHSAVVNGDAHISDSTTEDWGPEEIPTDVLEALEQEPEFDLSRLDKFDIEHLLLFATIDHTARDKTFQIYSGIVERLEKYGLVSLSAPRASGLSMVTIITPNGRPMVVSVTPEGREVAERLVADGHSK